MAPGARDTRHKENDISTPPDKPVDGVREPSSTRLEQNPGDMMGAN
jgi:hypothetical protein